MIRTLRDFIPQTVPLISDQKCGSAGIIFPVIRILSFQMSTLNLVLTIGCNLLYTGVLIWVLTRMFRSERLMFNA